MILLRNGLLKKLFIAERGKYFLRIVRRDDAFGNRNLVLLQFATKSGRTDSHQLGELAPGHSFERHNWKNLVY